MVGNTTVSNDNWTKGVFEQMDNKNCATTELWNQHTQIKSSSPIVKAGNVRTHTPDEAYERVMSYAGASNYRDKVDELIISDVKTEKQVAREMPANGKVFPATHKTKVDISTTRKMSAQP